MSAVLVADQTMIMTSWQLKINHNSSNYVGLEFVYQSELTLTRRSSKFIFNQIIRYTIPTILGWVGGQSCSHPPHADLHRWAILLLHQAELIHTIKYMANEQEEGQTLVDITVKLTDLKIPVSVRYKHQISISHPRLLATHTAKTRIVIGRTSITWYSVKTEFQLLPFSRTK